jgi:hypothetical protein
VSDAIEQFREARLSARKGVVGTNRALGHLRALWSWAVRAARRTCCSTRPASIPLCTSTTTNDPHQALDMATPASRYQPSTRPYQGLEELEYPHHDWTAVITTCGRTATSGGR